jgi:hypothetical protein
LLDHLEHLRETKDLFAHLREIKDLSGNLARSFAASEKLAENVTLSLMCRFAPVGPLLALLAHFLLPGGVSPAASPSTHGLPAVKEAR